MAALSLVLLPLGQAAGPGDDLSRSFEVAKASLAAGDLRPAEAHFRQTLVLGLRQLANLSLSEADYREATRCRDDALKLAPDDLEARVDASVAWFRRGEVGRIQDAEQALATFRKLSEDNRLKQRKTLEAVGA